MTRYVIALSELGIKNNNLISLLLEHFLEIEDMFDESRHVFDNNLDLMIYFDILNPWQHSGNSLSEGQWKLCNRNKNWACCEQNLN